jgi:pimeloyl-ACP methyl ester carboxylesterase
MYFMDDYDPRFGDAFYDGSWMEGIDQEQLLRAIECPTVYLKATTRYGDDGVLYAATTDEDAAKVRECLASCEYVEIDSGHDIHVEHPTEFVAAIDQAASLA